MDLLDLIRNQIKALPDGDHLPGLQAVLHHIEVAYKHYAQGQLGNEDSFTDTIYRTNMAFEGAIKETYRVLTGTNPSNLRPYDVEQYLEKNDVFRDRILGQFSSYRTDWRNPSSHDYNLNLDEPEAFLAIISVSAIVKLLVDEIAERLSFVAVQKDVGIQAKSVAIDSDPTEPLVMRVAGALASFPKFYKESPSAVPIESEAQLLGALSGFLASALPNVRITTGRPIKGHKVRYVDILAESNDSRVIIEIKRGDSPSLMDRGVEQLTWCLDAAHGKHGILFLYSPRSIDYGVTALEPRTGIDIYVVRPNLRRPGQDI